jgi:hypothetical protein
MIVPVLPIFLTAVLGAPVTAVGLIEGVAESTASIVRVFRGVNLRSHRPQAPHALRLRPRQPHQTAASHLDGLAAGAGDSVWRSIRQVHTRSST